MSVPYHPLVLLELESAEEARDRQNRIDSAKKSLDTALAKSKVEEAERAFQELKREASSDSHAREYIDQYEQDIARLVILRTLTTTLPAALESWGLQEIISVSYSLLKLPPSEARRACSQLE